VELLAAIVIIALLAALATPSFIAMIRDRRVVRAGLFIIDTHRESRTRALSRGVAVLVRWRADGTGRGAVQMREAIIVAAGTGAAKGCTKADWSDGSAETREVTKLDFATTAYELAQMKLFSTDGVESQIGDVCYAPDGQAWVRYSDNGGWTQLTGVLRYDITNTRTNFKRVVFIPPNGVARYQL
jgi:type IV fimbrial biogenesis protein FimT